MILSIESNSQINETNNAFSFFLQLDAVSNRKIAWLLTLRAGLPVTTAISNHSSCWLTIERGQHLQSELMRKTKVAKPWFRFCCATEYHLPQWPTQPSSNWLSAISEQRLQSMFKNKQLLQRRRFRCAYHVPWFPTIPLLKRLIVCAVDKEKNSICRVSSWLTSNQHTTKHFVLFITNKQCIR